jgi:hypothetical protein
VRPIGGLALPSPGATTDRLAKPRHLSLGARLGLGWEIVKGGFVELWAHKLRSTLTLTLLMLGVFSARRHVVGARRRHGQDFDRVSPA